MGKKNFLLSVFLTLFLYSCAGAPARHGALGSGAASPIMPEKVITSPEVTRGDVFHEVGPGETLWRISKMYDVSVQDIAKANDLKNIEALEKGQRLLIPNAASLISVIPLYPSTMWNYIIIHHSATDSGNALTFDYIHSNKRQWSGLGYHFVIDNGTFDTKDGHIEVSPRWLHQDYGAHCKADGMNYKGIGICLVGNFDNERVSPKELESLVYLVNTLKKYYDISNSNILGHGQVKGAATNCPGKNFPWEEFRSKLEH